MLGGFSAFSLLLCILRYTEYSPKSLGLKLFDRTITLKELLIITITLLITFGICGFISDHQTIDTKAIFSGAILGSLVSFLMGIYFSYTRKLVKKFAGE